MSVTGTNGLYYLRARCGACPERSRRDPTIGRFLTRDPLSGSARDPQSLNAYPYVGNNPVNRVDPTGMLTEGAEILDCQAGLLFGALAMLIGAYIAIGLAASVFIPYGWMLVASQGATFWTVVEGLHLMAAGGAGLTGSGLLTGFGLFTLLDACTNTDSRHGVTG